MKLLNREPANQAFIKHSASSQCPLEVRKALCNVACNISTHRLDSWMEGFHINDLLSTMKPLWIMGYSIPYKRIIIMVYEITWTSIRNWRYLHHTSLRGCPSPVLHALRKTCDHIRWPVRDLPGRKGVWGVMGSRVRCALVEIRQYFSLI